MNSLPATEISLNLQMQEINPGITLKILVERDQAATARQGEGCKVSVSPIAHAEVKLSGPLGQQFVHAWGFLDYANMWNLQPSLKRAPRSAAIQSRVSQNLAIREVPQEPKGRDAAKGKLARRLIIPIAPRTVVMNVFRSA